RRVCRSPARRHRRRPIRAGGHQGRADRSGPFPRPAGRRRHGDDAAPPVGHRYAAPDGARVMAGILNVKYNRRGPDKMANLSAKWMAGAVVALAFVQPGSIAFAQTTALADLPTGQLRGEVQSRYDAALARTSDQSVV